MEAIYFGIALITAGIAFQAGVMYIFAGLHKETQRFELVFGLQTISLFVFLMMPPMGFIVNDKAPYPLEIDIKRIFIWSYYLLLTLFIRSYSGYRNRITEYLIFILTAASYIIMVSTKNESNNPQWGMIAEITMGLIFYYGIVAARYQFKNNQRREGKWLLSAMSLYGFLYIVSVPYWILSQKSIFPFHLNVLVFTTVMGIRLRVNTLEKYRLEKALHMQDTRWNLLLQNMQLLIVELDVQGIVQYVNPFGINKFGYAKQEDLIGKNWFTLTALPEEVDARQAVFLKSIKDKNLLLNVTLNYRTRVNRRLVLSWTNILLKNDDGSIRGVLSLGIDNTELVQSFEQVQQLKDELEKENLALKNIDEEVQPEHDIIGESEAILYAIQKAKQVAVTHAGVLLLGETGSGKELFANLVHRNSYRRNKPFIKINCAALPAELIESELFGHEKGAFTGAYVSRKGKFEQADGGTIFLDEIGELPLALQAKLLRVLQSGEFERIGGQQMLKVDVRIVAATNKNLSEEIHLGKFREDLYYRLNVFPITVPSLRQRKEDIPLLTAHFIAKFSKDERKDISQISKADMARLCAYAWPGNVRELINLLERSVIQSKGQVLTINWLNQYRHFTPESEFNSLGEVEKAHILKVLKESNWKINGDEGAAVKLGLHPNTLRSRLKKLQIERGKEN